MWRYPRRCADSPTHSADGGNITRLVFERELVDAQDGEAIVPRRPLASGHLLPAAGRVQDEAYMHAEARQHVNQTVGAEQA